MGKAKILSGGKDGRYSLEMNYSLPGQDAERLKLIARRDKLTLELVEANEALGLRTQEVDETIQTLNAMILDWQNRKLSGDDPDPPVDPDKDKPKDPDKPPEPDDPPPPPPPPDLSVGLLSAHNTIRAANGLSTFGSNGALNSAAQAHAEWMVRGGVGHTGAGGSSPYNRILAAGFPWGGGAMIGENVAAGQKTVAEVMNGWMNSTGHRANILTPGFQSIGVGYAFASGSTYFHYWCVTFGRPPG